MTTNKQALINGIDTNAIRSLAKIAADDPSKGISKFRATTSWLGGTKSVAQINSWSMGGRELTKNFEIIIDEPSELLGENAAPNPQEFLLAALNACMTVGYAAVAALDGIQLTKLQIETHGELDLRGFLGNPDVAPGYENLEYTVTIAGDGTPEQLQAVHEKVMATSPNRWNIANAIKLHPRLVIHDQTTAYAAD